MLPLMEMLMQAGNGQSLEKMSSQFNLSREQTEKAMEALMPAFREGLKRNAADPMGFAGFMQALANGNHARYFEQPEKAMNSDGMAEGNAILGHLFGSKELSRAVAAQAAQASGLSQNILKQMLPALAPMILGGLFKQMNGQVGSASHASSSGNPWGDLLGQMMGGGKGRGANPWGDILEQMMGGGARGAPGPETSRRAPSPGGSSNPWGDILEQMMGRGGRSTTGGSGLPDGDDNPLGRIFEEMIKSGRATDSRTPEEDPYREPRQRREHDREETPREPERRPKGFDDLFGEMFETGRKTQNDYQRGMESIFDEFLNGMKRR